MSSLHVTSNREKIAMRISWYSIAVNVFLSLGKFIAGIFGHSAAMVSDAIHSASDVFATFIGTTTTNMAMNAWSVWLPSCSL